jgi:antitoxin component YwqK of YwqJK toxin-antitoxin module
VAYTSDSQKIEVGFMKDNKLHKQYKSFHQNGKIQFEGEFDYGTPIGIWSEYYQNEKKHSEYEIIGADEMDYIRKFINHWDSSGKKLISDGSGKMESFKYDLIFEESYKKGVLDGEVKILDSSRILRCLEKYENGKFVSGFNYASRINYNSATSGPVFREGKEDFTKFLSKFMKKESKKPPIDEFHYFELNVPIKAEIIISEKGEIEDVLFDKKKLTQTKFSILDEIKATSGQWKPALRHGQPVKSVLRYNFIFNSSGYFKFFDTTKNPLWAAFDAIGSISQIRMGFRPW